MESYVVAIALFFFGGLVQGCLGFGMAMLVVPPMLLMYPQTTVVPALTMASLINTTSTAWVLRANVQRKLVGPLVVGAACGIPVGVYLLTSIPGEPFKAGVGVFMVALSALLLSGWRRPVKDPHFALYPVGFASGILNGSVSISGPPIILFLSNQNAPRDVFRATTLAFFAFSGIVAITAFTLSGVLTGNIARFSIGLWPSVVLGTAVGARLATRIPQLLFQRLTLLTAAVMGLVLFVQNVL